jgi:hypothetical protein
MNALPIRLCRLIASIAVGGAALLWGSAELRGEDVPFVQKTNGPYMVLARVFRGPATEEYAKALASELRQEHKLPAYLLRSTAKGEGQTEAFAVLVGDAKTLEESESLLKQVKGISPRCLADISPPSLRTLRRAMRTTNPLVPAQQLFKQR